MKASALLVVFLVGWCLLPEGVKAEGKCAHLSEDFEKIAGGSERTINVHNDCSFAFNWRMCVSVKGRVGREYVNGSVAAGQVSKYKLLIPATEVPAPNNPELMYMSHPPWKYAATVCNESPDCIPKEPQCPVL